MAYLGVNIDHVATVRQARMTDEPDPVWAAACAELGGADCITIHLREDRRHIQDRDFLLLRETTRVRLNLEMACDDQIVELACAHPPDQVTLVPENRDELTTEGGLDIVNNANRIGTIISKLKTAGIPVSLFLDPAEDQIQCAIDLEVDAIELHTGAYAESLPDKQYDRLHQLVNAATLVNQARILLNAGHGLTYNNVQPIASISGMHELNIGHSIIARSIFTGLENAVSEMKRLVSDSYIHH
jgi:pyridoxine 5-phosphate synthase